MKNHGDIVDGLLDAIKSVQEPGNLESGRALAEAITSRIQDLELALETAVEALEHYAVISDVDGALGRDRRAVAREALVKINSTE